MLTDFLNKLTTEPTIEDILKKLGTYPEEGRFYVESRITPEMIYADKDNGGFIPWMFRNMFDKLWDQAIFPNIGKSLFIRTGISTFQDKFDLVVRIKADMSFVSERPVIYKLVPSMNEIPPDTYKCEFCGGYTYNDQRGHCCACGAPRQDKAYYSSQEI